MSGVRGCAVKRAPSDQPRRAVCRARWQRWALEAPGGALDGLEDIRRAVHTLKHNDSSTGIDVALHSPKHYIDVAILVYMRFTLKRLC